jgi:hypothetical protein
MCPAWSPSEHQLTPALSPIQGPRPKPCRPEEVVYSPNDSCSHFTQHLFPSKLPQQHTCTTSIIHSSSFILIIYHIQASNHNLLLHDEFTLFISSVLHSRLAAFGLLCPIHSPQTACLALTSPTHTPSVFARMQSLRSARSPSAHALSQKLFSSATPF